VALLVRPALAERENGSIDASNELSQNRHGL